MCEREKGCIFSIHNQCYAAYRIFLGKNKVLQLALGRNESDEYKDGLHFVSQVSDSYLIAHTRYNYIVQHF